MNSKLLCTILSVALLACGKNEPAPPALSSPAAASATVPAPVSNDPAQAHKDSPLQIKGLYLGMDVQAVPGAMISILAEQGLSDFGFTDVMRAEDGSGCVLMYTKSFLRAIDARARDRQGEARAAGKLDEEMRSTCVNSDGVLVVKSGTDDKVYRIEFNDVKNLFNASGLTPAEFASKLSQDAHIPQLQANEAQTSWVYTSPSGERVEVTSKDVLGIKLLRLYLGKAAP